ncbi:hypothetical protein ACA910_014049 [Epithemia clementina (nom. ined.)]
MVSSSLASTTVASATTICVNLAATTGSTTTVAAEPSSSHNNSTGVSCLVVEDAVVIDSSITVTFPDKKTDTTTNNKNNNKPPTCEVPLSTTNKNAFTTTGTTTNNRNGTRSQLCSFSSPADLRLLPRNNREYGTLNYWEDRFESEEPYDWLLSFPQLEPQLRRYIVPRLEEKQQQELRQPESCDCDDCVRILVVGCGNAPFSADLYRACQRWVEECHGRKGERSSSNRDDEQNDDLPRVKNASRLCLVNIDYSATVIDKMQQTYPSVEYPGMTWHVADMTEIEQVKSILLQGLHNNTNTNNNASFPCIDLVIDKAAMDAILADEGDLWYPNIAPVRRARDMCQCISQVLSPDHGTFLQISLAQPHFRQKYLLGQWQLTGESKKDGNNSNDNDSDDQEEVVAFPLETIGELPYSPQYQWTLHHEPAGRPQDIGSFGHFLYVMTKQLKLHDE